MLTSLLILKGEICHSLPLIRLSIETVRSKYKCNLLLQAISRSLYSTLPPFSGVSSTATKEDNKPKQITLKKVKLLYMLLYIVCQG